MEEASEDHRERGNTLFKEGRYADARDQYTEGLKCDSTNAVIYSNRSAAHAKLEDYELALRDAEKCIEHKPQWAKGFVRKTIALEGLHRYDEAMQSASRGFRLTGESKIKREFVTYWLKANQMLNRLPEGSIELPSGIVVLSRNYLYVLACLMRSLDGECPLSLELTEQCLMSCAEQLEQLLMEFGESVDPVIKEWAKHLPYEVYPYSIKPVAKGDLEQQMKTRSDSFISFLNSIDPTLNPLLQPIMGLIVLVVLNRTNILTECNTGHHSAELMNRALLPLFESSLLSTNDYYSMYVGRICAVLDSFIGRGYKLDDKEIVVVLECCSKLQKTVKNYPVQLPGYHKDKQLAEQTLSNVTSNILQPVSLSPSSIPPTSAMSVELAEQLVKDKPGEVKMYLEKHLKELKSAKFLTMGEVEELLTMTGIYHQLGMRDDAVKVFMWGEQAFFQVLGHMLSSHTLKLDQCPATIAPIRQLVLSEVSILNDQELFANVILRWKCLFRELRSQLISCNVSNGFGDFFQWYMSQQTSTVEDGETESALLKQLQDEEKLLQNSAKQTLQQMSETTYAVVQQNLSNNTIVVDYIFFVPLTECRLLEAYCVIFRPGHNPVIHQLDYNAIHKHAAVVTELLSSTSNIAKANSELTILAQLLFPQALVEMLASETIDHLYISPDSDITLIPFDCLPVKLSLERVAPLFELVPVSIVSSLRKLVRHNVRQASGVSENVICTIIGNPNFNLAKNTGESSGVGKLINYLCDYLSISSAPSGPILEQLVYSEEEVSCISQYLQLHGFNTQLLVGDAATLYNVLSLNAPLLIHVSSHAYAARGQLRSAFRGNFFTDLNCAAIALTGFNTFSKGNFKQLPADCGTAQLPPLALLSMKLQGTKLVFLSTCNSASGISPIQEAVDSLAEAFLAAGVETVIASLWPISDQLAGEISKAFYTKLVIPGTRPSEALVYVKKHFKKQDEEFYWSTYAAFACYGVDEPLVT